ncbi:hypothetical protein [Streptomyces sp. NPDC005336]|uniref:hypothetical protein n=1 Tax=Streptomyces sp. NPDC005336 TaxID=3157035 RepID=UPI0033B92E19
MPTEISQPEADAPPTADTSGTATGTATGTVAAGFEPIREAFETALAAEPGHAAQLAVYADGQPVADLWGGPRPVVAHCAVEVEGAHVIS